MKQPTKKPIYTCEGVCACIANRAKPIAPATIKQIQIAVKIGSCIKKQMANKAPIKPPMPIMCVLICQRKLISAAIKIHRPPPKTNNLTAGQILKSDSI